MASIPDIAILHFCDLSPAEIKVYAFYCKCRNKISGGWRCADQFVGDEMNLSRNRVTEARNGLLKKNWIAEGKNNFIQPLFGFENVENSTNKVENSTFQVENSTSKVENSTNIVENSTKKVENSTFPLKESLNQPHNQPHQPEGREDVRAPQRKLSVDEAAGILEDENEMPVPPEITSRSIEIYREVYPTTFLEVEQLKYLVEKLPAVEEAIWRQNVKEWKVSRWKASNIADMVKRYERELGNHRKLTENGEENGKNHRHQNISNGGGKPTAAAIIANRPYRRSSGGSNGGNTA